MKRDAIILILLFVTSLLPAANAQTETPETFTQTLAIQPLYLLNNGLRIDYERQLCNPNQWLQISAIGYYIEDNDALWTYWDWSSSYGFNRAWGAGLEINYKYFPTERRQLYFSGGLSASHFNVGYNEYQQQYDIYMQDGLTYYEPQWVNRHLSQRFNRIGMNFYIGRQNRPSRRFLLDWYAGIGRAHSFYNEGRRSPERYYGSLSYSGVTFTLGVRLGFRL
ncbi:MAG: hypothetical protein LBS05_05255 [Tannerellaceae bacterium]|jgi:hypothetical protein|nr:hypothetical protein [Tannerellaceae bacterium]